MYLCVCIVSTYEDLDLDKIGILDCDCAFFFVNLRNNPICKMSTEFRKFFFIVDKRFATSSESWLAISMQMHIAVIAQSINSFFSFCPVINELDGCLHQGIIYF